jgi:hypothetical protein
MCRVRTYLIVVLPVSLTLATFVYWRDKHAGSEWARLTELARKAQKESDDWSARAEFYSERINGIRSDMARIAMRTEPEGYPGHGMKLLEVHEKRIAQAEESRKKCLTNAAEGRSLARELRAAASQAASLGRGGIAGSDP